MSLALYQTILPVCDRIQRDLGLYSHQVVVLQESKPWPSPFELVLLQFYPSKLLVHLCLKPLWVMVHPHWLPSHIPSLQQEVLRCLPQLPLDQQLPSLFGLVCSYFLSINHFLNINNGSIIVWWSSSLLLSSAKLCDIELLKTFKRFLSSWFLMWSYWRIGNVGVRIVRYIFNCCFRFYWTDFCVFDRLRAGRRLGNVWIGDYVIVPLN